MAKKIQYIMPIDWLRGALSGRQTITYQGTRAYEVQSDTLISADNYRPTLIAKLMSKRNLRYYQVRTKTSVHMSSSARENLAVMGGAGAIFAALVNRGENLHRVVSFPVLMSMLRSKANNAQLEGISVDNPWRVQNPNVTIAPAIIAKFNNELS